MDTLPKGFFDKKIDQPDKGRFQFASLGYQSSAIPAGNTFTDQFYNFGPRISAGFYLKSINCHARLTDSANLAKAIANLSLELYFNPTRAGTMFPMNLNSPFDNTGGLTLASYFKFFGNPQNKEIGYTWPDKGIWIPQGTLIKLAFSVWASFALNDIFENYIYYTWRL